MAMQTPAASNPGRDAGAVQMMRRQAMTRSSVSMMNSTRSTAAMRRQADLIAAGGPTQTPRMMTGEPASRRFRDAIEQQSDSSPWSVAVASTVSTDSTDSAGPHSGGSRRFAAQSDGSHSGRSHGATSHGGGFSNGAHAGASHDGAFGGGSRRFANSTGSHDDLHHDHALDHDDHHYGYGYGHGYYYGLYGYPYYSSYSNYYGSYGLYDYGYGYGHGYYYGLYGYPYYSPYSNYYGSYYPLYPYSGSYGLYGYSPLYNGYYSGYYDYSPKAAHNNSDSYYGAPSVNSTYYYPKSSRVTTNTYISAGAAAAAPSYETANGYDGQPYGSGWEDLSRGRTRTAFRYFSRQASRNIDDALPKVGYALSSAMLGVDQRAAWAMRRAFNADPYSIGSLHFDKRLLKRIDRLAEHYAQRADDADDPDADFMLASLSFLIQDYELAAIAVDSAIEHGDRSDAAANLKAMIPESDQFGDKN